MAVIHGGSAYPEAYKRNVEVALLVAILAHIAIVHLILPEFEYKRFYERDRRLVYIRHLQLPERKKPVERRRVEPEEVKVKPVPDPTPHEPEQFAEPEPDITVDNIPDDALILFGQPPVGPPEPQVPDGPVRLAVGMDPPRIIERIQPEYPPVAKRARIEGMVILEAVIGKDGTVGQVTILRSMGKSGMDESAVSAVQQWKFEPARMNGQPVSVIMSLTVFFRLR